jgi:acetolactate synthase-1/2/3 large subunit
VASMKVYEQVARGFAAEGVDAIFALMGDGNMGFLGSFAALPGTRLVQVRHENMAVGMADGYARTGRPVGAASVTYGPGLSQIPTSLLVASRHHSAVVVFAGEPPATDRYPGSAHEMDQQALVHAAEAGYVAVRSPATVAEDVAAAFAQARRERRPVVLATALDVQYTETDAPAPAPRPQRAAPTPRPTPASIQQAVDLLAEARRPLLMVGAGALAAVAESEALAAQVGAVIVTTIAAKGAFAGNARCIGLAGSFADERTSAAIEEADVVLALGTRLDPYVTRRAAAFKQARVIQVDLDPEATIALVRRPDVLVNSDARAAIVELAARLPARSPAQAEPSPFDFTSADLAAFPCDPEPGTLDPRLLMVALGEHLPDACTIVVGAGHFSAFPLLYLPGRRSHRYLPVFDFGSIGQGLPVAVGAAVAAPDRAVIGFEGDASLLMNVQELETIGRVRPRLLLFVMNDGALGAEYHRLGRMGIDPDLAAYERAGFEAVAAAFGVRARTLASVEGASDVVAEFLAADGPLLVDVRASRRSIVPLYRPPA